MELWRDIRGYEGLYQVSNYGRIRSLDRMVKGRCGGLQLKRGKIMILEKGRNGYIRVSLKKDGKYKHHSVHRLVYETFIGTIPEGMQVNHIDEDKTNNFVFVNPDGSVDLEKSNLNLMTPKENINWGTGHERCIAQQCFPILQYTLDGELVREWSSAQEAGRNGFKQSNVRMCCLGIYKTSKGYIWKYKNPHSSMRMRE